MQADERVGVEPVPADAVPAVDQGHPDVGVVDQGVGERHAHGARTHHEVVGVDRARHAFNSSTEAASGLRGLKAGFEYLKAHQRRSTAINFHQTSLRSGARGCRIASVPPSALDHGADHQAARVGQKEADQCGAPAGSPTSANPSRRPSGRSTVP